MPNLWFFVYSGGAVALAVLGPLWGRWRYFRAATRLPNARQLWIRYTIASECFAAAGLCAAFGVIAPSQAAKDALMGSFLVLLFAGIALLFSLARLVARGRADASRANRREERHDRSAG